VARPATPADVLLFASLIYNPASDLERVLENLQAEYGRFLLATPPMTFDFTDYYHREMGGGLERVIVAFSRLVPRDCLVSAKTFTNALEDSHRRGADRTVNIDPGIVTLENVCLATTKPHAHRIYLCSGIWAEVTLMYRGNSYRKLPWTYPDYASDAYIHIFNSLRNEYKGRIACPRA